MVDQRKKELYEEGVRLFNAGDYYAASMQFDKAINMDEKYFDALYMRGLSSFKMKDYSTAVEWLEKAYTERPNDVKLNLLLVEVYHHVGRRSNIIAAVRICEKMLMYDPKNLDARILYLRILIDRGVNYEPKLLAVIDALMKEDVKDSRLYCYFARYKIKKKLYEEADDIVVKHYEGSEDWVETVHRLMDNYKDKKKYADVEKLYNLIIEHAAEKLPYQMELVQFYRETVQTEKEETLFKLMLKSNVDKMHIKLDYANFLLHYRMFEKAEAYLTAEIKNNPDSYDLKELLIATYKQTNRIAEAIDFVNNTLSTIPSDDIKTYFEYKNYLADLYFKKGDYDISRKISGEIIKELPTDRNARFNMCRLDLQQGNTLAAIGGLRLLITQNANVGEYYYYLGLAHEMRKEPEMAEIAFRNAITVSPEHKEALKRWIAVYEPKGSLQEIQIRVKKYLATNPNDQEITALLQSIKDHRNSTGSRAVDVQRESGSREIPLSPSDR